ncbi:outer membrane lipid asymmetry maintenance protein MlaD [uncultured Ferrovibrio sp.]|jgi:phospholipid/cholesterol/gamma-HCH transport system substrate-binding protein|uniref:outer membrane lipid asymmetry maintenance protein MlaD n=1 Tax=uncultured Ferrovibrio sp. TaxID=1576913 RepID=UPI00261A2904|nr:outer membrane lipid asymmetry maintenance protein MlaD [uncultured Ferrovibrio sp.]
MNGNLVETLIGAVVLAVALFFLGFAYTKTGFGNAGLSGYELHARFNRADGLVVGGDVRLSGIKIGTITRQTLDPKTYTAVVTFSVDSRYELPEDTAVKVASEGLLGGNYLSIEPGGSDVMLKAGQEVKYTQGSVNLMDLIGQAIFSATGAGNSGKGQEGGETELSPLPK